MGGAGVAGVGGGEVAGPDAHEPGPLEHAPRRAVLGADIDDDRRRLGLVVPAAGHEGSDRRRADAAVRQLDLTDEVVDAERGGWDVNHRQRVHPLGVVVDAIALDHADRSVVEDDHEQVRRVVAVDADGEVALDGVGRRIVLPPPLHVRPGEPSAQHLEVGTHERPERDRHRPAPLPLPSIATTASPQRRPENSAPWIDAVSRWSPQTNRPSPRSTRCFGANAGR